MADLIVLDDYDDDDVPFGVWPICKRQRISHEDNRASHQEFALNFDHCHRLPVPDTSDDAVLARLLQDEEDKHIVAVESVVVPTAPPDCVFVDLDPACEISEARVPGDEEPTSPINVNVARKQDGRGQLHQRQQVGDRNKFDVKLVFDHGLPLVVKVRPDTMLATIFSNASVKKRLRATCGMQRVAASFFCHHFCLHRGLPEPKVFDFALAENISVIDALGGPGAVLRVRQEGAPIPGNPPDLPSPRGRVSKSQAKKSQAPQIGGAERAGNCDSVQIVRLRKPGDDFGSPVAIVKNFNRDRGALLARLTGLREMVEMAPEARAALTQNVRSELDSYARGGQSATGEVQRASNRVLDIVEDAVMNDLPAHSALGHRTDYASTAVLVYDKGQTLPRHIDNCGHWVVLFSFGRTVDFHAGGSTVEFESGDVLVFNGSKRDAVMHGIDKMHPGATLGGKKSKLPAELDYLEKCRVSFQARQGDAL